MLFIRRLRLFQKTACAIFFFFMGLMVVVSVAAFARKSGQTGLDMAKVQQMRYEANKSARQSVSVNK